MRVWTRFSFAHSTNVLKAGSKSVLPTAPGKAWLREEDPTCQRLRWLRRETDLGTRVVRTGWRGLEGEQRGAEAFQAEGIIQTPGPQGKGSSSPMACPV